jgi:elongation factor Ts
MAFTATDVKDLREMTGCGMMDCKKALTESDGDIQKAIDWLREKGLAAAQKKAGRIAAEGIAHAAVIDNVGVVVEVNAETDFVAQNDKFVDFVKNVAVAVAKNEPGDLEALLGSRYPASDKTVREMQQEMVLVIGENITVRRYARYTTGVNVPYVHAGGKIGVMVNMEVAGIANMDAVVTLGKDIAMQIAAMRPTYLDKSEVDQSVMDKEKEILTIQAKEDPKNAGKPDNILEKMVMGRLSKFYEENCLLQQAFVKGDKISVEQHVKQVAKELGGTITVKAFTRFEKGEGIEKKQENFAEEISKLVQ